MEAVNFRGGKSYEAPSRWSAMAIVDCRQDAVFPVTDADGDEPRDAPVRVTQQPPATWWRGCRAAGGGRGSATAAGCPGCPPRAGRFIGRVLRDGGRGAHAPSCDDPGWGCAYGPDRSRGTRWSHVHISAARVPPRRGSHRRWSRRPVLAREAESVRGRPRG